MTLEIDLPDPEATARLAAGIADALPENPGSLTILLQGELGSGKSTWARAFLRALGHEGAVPSPTYTLVEPYEFADFVIYHIDLYRISDEEELRYLAWSDLSDGLRLIEWPERAPRLANEADLRIRLDYRDEGRRATVEGLSDAGQALLDASADRVSASS